MSSFQRLFCTLLFLAGITGSVLIRGGGVLTSEVLNREVPVYTLGVPDKAAEDLKHF